MTGSPRRVRSGRVVAFDGQRGLGVIETDDGGRFGFHCTAIADGTRSIELGSRVTFHVVAGLAGAWEAARVDALVA